MVEKAFLHIENYLSFFKDINTVYEEKDTAFNNIRKEILAKYGHILENKEDDGNDDETTESSPPVSVEPKNESKAKSRCSHATSNQSINNITTCRKSKRGTIRQNASNSDETGVECMRKSSRILKSKTSSILKQKELIDEDYELVLTNGTSKDVQTGIRQNLSIDELQDQMQSLSISLTSVNTEKMNAPVGCSTPTTPRSPEGDRSVVAASNENKQTPICEPANEEKSDSVKKRIEEFENLQKMLEPIASPKEALLQPSIVKLKKAPSFLNKPKLRSTTARLLQENKTKNINISEQKTESVPKKPFTNKQRAENLKLTKTERCRKQEGSEKEAVKMKKDQPKSKEKSENQQIQEEPSASKPTTSIKCLEVVEYALDHVESDYSEDEDNSRFEIPNWASKKNREFPLKVQAWLNKEETVYKWFHNENLKRPNTKELFSGQVKMRTRTSSAVWNTYSFHN